MKKLTKHEYVLSQEELKIAAIMFIDEAEALYEAPEREHVTMDMAYTNSGTEVVCTLSWDEEADDGDK